MKIRDVVGYLLMLFTVALVLLFANLGMVRYVVGSSMEPTYKPGDVLILRRGVGEITPGMIVSYQTQNRLVTHRVIAIEGESLVTQGDNNSNPDPWLVPLETVVGTPTLRIPLLGYLVHFIRQPIGWTIFVLLPVGVILFGEIKKILVMTRKIKAAESGK